MLFSIEGNIGSGKSTFCNYLRQHFTSYYNVHENKTYNVYFVDEPVDEWVSIKDNNGLNLLENFYKCPQKYSFCFQMTAYISRLSNLKKILKKASVNDIIITERSVFSDYNVFAKMLYDSGEINSIEYQCYIKWFEHFLEDIPPIFYVYIKTFFVNCHDRVIRRARQGENPISADYLKMCEKYHEDWLSKESHTIVLDGNKSVDYHHEHLNRIKHYINYIADASCADNLERSAKYFKLT